MSDRRPENPEMRAVFGPGKCGDLDCVVHAPTRKALSGEIIAELRRGVESGEIEGEVRWWTPHRGRIERHKGHLWEDQGPIVDGELSPVDRDGYWVLVIPTDGGSE